MIARLPSDSLGGLQSDGEGFEEVDRKGEVGGPEGDKGGSGARGANFREWAVSPGGTALENATAKKQILGKAATRASTALLRSASTLA